MGIRGSNADTQWPLEGKLPSHADNQARKRPALPVRSQRDDTGRIL